MIQGINLWMQSIIVAVIITTIVELILPDGNNKKYVKTILGIYIVFTIIVFPVKKIFGIKIEFNQLLYNYEKEMKKYEVNAIDINTNSYIEDIHIKNLKKDIKQKLEEKNYELLDLKLDVETNNDELYGIINNMSLSVKEIENSKTVNNIKKIDINISHTETEYETISEDKTSNLKEYLSNYYSIDIDKIHINE